MPDSLERKRARMRLWREQHPQEAKERNRKTFAKHREKILAQQRAYWENNKELIKERRRGRRDRIRVQKAKYVSKNLDKYAAYAARRRALKRGSGGRYTPEDVAEILAKQRSCCAYCRLKIRGRNYNVDHIVPLIMGGRNDKANIQVTCVECNLRKGDKDPIVFSKELGLLL